MHGSNAESQASTTQTALNRAAERNGGGNLAAVPDIASMMNSVGAGPEPFSKSVSATNPFGEEGNNG
jgi:hypothetical protein